MRGPRGQSKVSRLCPGGRQLPSPSPALLGPSRCVLIHVCAHSFSSGLVTVQDPGHSHLLFRARWPVSCPRTPPPGHTTASSLSPLILLLSHHPSPLSQAASTLRLCPGLLPCGLCSGREVMVVCWLSAVQSSSPHPLTWPL